MKIDLTEGSIIKNMAAFAVPMIMGNLLQQLYNVADTYIVGRFVGPDALAAVGSAYTLMVFLTSIILGLCLGTGSVFAVCFGEKNYVKLKNCIFLSFLMIALITLIINAATLLGIDPILRMLRVPEAIYGMMRSYVNIIFWGITFTFLYNYLSALLRAVGDSVTPLIFLALSAAVNVVLDVWFVAGLGMGVAGAAIATVIAQALSAAGIMIYGIARFEVLRLKPADMHWNRSSVRELFSASILTCMQQSVMNFGILMVQGLVNSFGTAVMAAFAVAVKVDSFAYMPLQDFGNAFSVFIAQNFGAGKRERVIKGLKGAMMLTAVFSVIISAVVVIFAKPLMLIFVAPEETEIIRVGVQYLRIEGSFYIGIGCLFLFYGYFRAVMMPGVSLILTIISLGTRVLLSYMLAPIPAIGVQGIWWSIPIGWFLADMTGAFFFIKYRSRLQRASIRP